MPNNRYVEEYKKQTKICATTDFTNKSSVRKNNQAVDQMYRIVDEVSKDLNTTKAFLEVLHIEENRTRIWAAVHILEKLVVDKQTEVIALKIIKTEAKSDSTSALGFTYWLQNYTSQNKLE